MVRAAVPQGNGHAGPALAGEAESAEDELVILDAGDMPHDALAVGGPHVDAETEMRSRYRHRFQSSKPRVVAAQVEAALAA
jgi:hypothetical protein